MVSYVPPKRATELICVLGLPSRATPGDFQVDPTIEAGDVLVSKDGGDYAPITDLPVVAPAGGSLVQVTLSADEMDAAITTVQFKDVSGNEWSMAIIPLYTVAQQLDDIPTAIENADALLKRDMSAVTGEASRSPLNALRSQRNKWSIIAGVLTVTKEDDTTPAWTADVVQTAGNPVTSVDPV